MNLALELPVPLADITKGVSAEMEQLACQAGLLIMQAVMDSGVERLPGPNGRHEADRAVSRWSGRDAGRDSLLFRHGQGQREDGVKTGDRVLHLYAGVFNHAG